MPFAILTDTSANLPTPYTQENTVTVLPLTLSVHNTNFSCTDTETYDFENFYSKMLDGIHIHTSQINPQSYVDVMEPILKQNQDILFIGMSSGISGSFVSASIAKTQLEEEFPNQTIVLIDSLAASLGEGRLVQKAVTCRAQGWSLQETADFIEKEKKRVCQIFTVDDLMYLRKGGRLSNASAILGTILSIKPLLKGNAEGKIVSYAKTRGRKAVLKHLANKYALLVQDAASQCVGISHCNCIEDAKALAQLLREKQPPKEIQIVAHEPVTGSYLGPGALALYFDGDSDVRNK